MSATETGGVPPARMRDTDWLILGAYCLVLFSIPSVVGPILTSHETVHCVNTREMLTSADLVIPTYGGRPWLERPPLPFWITGTFVQLSGRPDADWPYRLGSILMGLVAVLAAAWIAARWLGRGLGLLSGLILATMREVRNYASTSEADIFVCALVTLALALFVRTEFRRRPDGRVGFLGGRPWQVLAFFLVLGLTNLTKGLIFGMMFVLLPAGAFLLLGRDGKGIRRYLWLWGWLAFLAAALPWPLLAYSRCPSILELWKSDYLGRWSQEYMREPWWYYLANLPWNLFPWTVFAFLGLWLTRPWVGGSGSERDRRVHTFLWCWAIVPVVWLSLARGKHHHYLLQCMAPWAILAALGARRFWTWCRTLAPVWRSPALAAALCGVPVAVALLVAGNRVPGPTWVLAAVGVCWPVLAGVLWWASGAASVPRALAATFTSLLLSYAAVELYWDQCIHRPKYAADLALMKKSLREVPPGQRLLVVSDHGPLGASLWLHYLEGRAELLHNLTFLRAAHYREDSVYVIARRFNEPRLAAYGTFERWLESERTANERSLGDRWTLYRLRFHDDLRRVEAPPIDAMQATGRAQGPVLE